MKKEFFFLTFFLTCFAWANTPVENVQAKLQAIRSMQADFIQIVTAGKREISQSTGKMALQRLGKFRWQTESPMKQLVIADGQCLWVYDVELEQVTVKKQENSFDETAGLFLSGYNDRLTHDFFVTAKINGQNTSYELKAKAKKANFQKVKLTFKRDVLTTMELYDQLGQHTLVKLINIKNNPHLATKLFQFKPPKGVDVVQQ